MTYGQPRNSGIPLLGSYAQALEKFNTTKPIRGREVECRPLGHRNRTHFSIDKDEASGDVRCYETAYYRRGAKEPSIIFRPNGEVRIKPVWTSISTCGFIYDVLGVYSKIFDGNAIISVRKGDYRIFKDGITIKRNEEGGYEVINYVPHFVHSVKRKEANIVRAKYVEFREFLEGLIKLRGSTNFNREEQEELFGYKDVTHEYYDGTSYTYREINMPSMDLHKPEAMQTLFNLVASDDPAERFKVAVTICYRARTPADAFSQFDKCVLAHHKAEVFEAREVSEGQIVKDRYSWAF